MLMLAVLLWGMLCTGAFAMHDPDAMPNLPADGTYSLSVILQSSNPDGSKTPIRGAKLRVYKAANLRVKNTAAYYTATSEFQEAGVDFDGMTAEASNAAAKKFAEIVDKKNLKGQGISGKTDGSGKATFPNLEEGIYLVMPDGYDSVDERYSEMEPFLVCVPGIQKGENANSWLFDVVVYPKLEIEPQDYVDVDPPVIKRVKGNRFSREKFVFELKSENGNNPMPIGSRNGRKQTTITGSGKSGFGLWRFTEPGTYTYRIREIKGRNTHYKYDATEYRLEYRTYYSGSKMKLQAKLTDSKGNVCSAKNGLIFTNQYRMIPTPETGDDANMLLWILCIAAALGGTAAIARRRCR